jgi:gamma-glutamyltranspeptidase / glutathione hydrolase
MPRAIPFHPRVATRGMVTTADQLASSAGITMLERGGSAADAMIGAAAVMAVVGPHLCGFGGDVLVMIKAPGAKPVGLLAIGRAGSGADPDRLRAEGHADMPLRGDVRSAPVPGAVDGWLAMHGRYGRLPWSSVLEPALSLAVEGFAASTILAFASHLVADVPGASDLCPTGPLRPGQRVRRPGIARILRDLASDGRDGFYGGEFGQALLALGAGEYTADDL